MHIPVQGKSKYCIEILFPCGVMSVVPWEIQWCGHSYTILLSTACKLSTQNVYMGKIASANDKKLKKLKRKESSWTTVMWL